VEKEKKKKGKSQRYIGGGFGRNRLLCMVNGYMGYLITIGVFIVAGLYFWIGKEYGEREAYKRAIEELKKFKESL